MNAKNVDEKGDRTTKKKPKMPEAEKREELPLSEEKGALPPSEEMKLVGHEETKQLEAGKVEELEERLLRLQADFENYKKRAAKENDLLRETTKADVLSRLLPIVDEFEIALSYMKKPEHKEFRHGMEIIYSKILDLLKKEGIEEMKALGESFDPYKHDAIRQEKGEEGKIIEVVQKGYVFKGKPLRHAKVVVGKGKEVK